MDKEIRDKHYRIVGALKALDDSAKAVECMPNDETTAVLLDTIRGLTNKAFLSAWQYAERRTSPETESAK